MLKAFHQDILVEAGCDEAGRGCSAGPVFAAAVILSRNFSHPGLNDSKQLTAAAREEMSIYIEKNAIAYSVAMIEVQEIDTINILNASFKAMHLALDKLNIVPGLLLIDGNRFNTYKNLRHECIIKGDGIYASIAAASVLAKTYRDAYMLRLHEQYPQYGWDANKGYGTPAHRKAIMSYGLCEHHRKSFQCLPAQLNLFK